MAGQKRDVLSKSYKTSPCKIRQSLRASVAVFKYSRMRLDLFNYTNRSFEELLAKSKMPTLHLRRLGTTALDVYDILNRQAPCYLHDPLTVKIVAYSSRYKSWWTINDNN